MFPQRRDRRNLLVDVVIGDINVMIRRRRTPRVFQVQGLELLTREVLRAAHRSSAGFLQRHVQADEDGVREPQPVQRHRVWSDHIRQHRLDALRNEVAGQAAGVLDTEALLASSVFPVPRGCVTTDDHVAYVVDVNDSPSRTRLSQEPRCRTLPDSRPSGEDERWSHFSSIPRLDFPYMSREPEIFWLGGPAAAGKTTVSRLLARKHGFLWYSVDAHAFAHEKRAAAAGLHVMGTGPGDFDRRPMILEDIRALPVDASVVVEGAFVTPTMAGVAANAVWLMPSGAEQLARLEHRHPGGVHKDFVWGWNLVRSQLEGTGAAVIVVDGQTVEQTLKAVEEKFGAILESSPAARTTEERQILLRLSNRQLAEHATDRLRSGRNHPVCVFDCECAQANCTELVEIAVEETPTLLAQAPPAIISPEHSN